LELQGIKAQGGMAEAFDGTQPSRSLGAQHIHRQLSRTPRSKKQEGSQITRGSFYFFSPLFF